jgi:peptidoglycan-N-acetylglucosamine deacetylase
VSRLCAISVDLDAIRYYRAIHGLPSRLEAAGSDPVLHVAVPRLATWALEQGIPLTWFVVGSDLNDPAFADLLLGLCHRGHELANHSLDHHYDLTRRGYDEIRAQVLEVAERLSRLTGEPRHGFRAPGYTMSDELHLVLRELDVLYDSSVFPCPSYYAAKAIAMRAQRIFGRASHAILDEPRVLTAPTRPYRMGASYLQPGNGVLELPIQVTPGLRLPYIGTTLTLLGGLGARLLTRQLLDEPFINLELHGIDVLDVSDGLAELGLVQRDLRIAWQSKLQVFTTVMRQLKEAGFRFVTLRRAALGIATDRAHEPQPGPRVQ